MKLSKKQRQELRMKFGGYCAYCGQLLPEKGWHADHVQAVLRVHTQDMEAAKKGLWKLKATGEHYREHNDTLENMFPSCAPCNLFKTTYTLEQFRKQIGEQVSRARSYSVNFRTAERFGLVQIVERPVVFWFEIYPLIVQNNS